MHKQLLIVYDIEGVITDNSQRLHLMRSGLWDEYEKAFTEDAINVGVAKVISKLTSLTSPFVSIAWTGRYYKFRDKTFAMLAANDLHPDQMLMRDDLDYMPKKKEVELKLEMLEGIKVAFPPEEYHYLFLEDRDDVIEALRNAGYECWQVRNGQIG